jgi:hypothetical protein
MPERRTSSRPTVVFETVPGSRLAGNPLNDPVEREIPVYLPPSYDGKRSFPVIYLLSGFASTGKSFLNYSFGRQTVPEIAERLISSGLMKEVILVMPDCMTRYGGSQYLDSAGTGNYESYLLEDLIPHIDRTFCTVADGEHRAVAGKSSGGFGAISLGMKHPGIFSAVACHSGDMGFELSYMPNFPLAARILEKYRGSLSVFFETYESAPKKPRSDFPLLDIMAMSAAYSPDPEMPAPENMRLPFRPYTCEIIPDVWQSWLAHDPLVMLNDELYREALRGMKLLYLDCGSYDEYHLHYGHRRFSAIAKSCCIDHRYEEFPDSHSDTSYRYDISLPLLSSSIAVR